jgi:hypothetical protein
MKCCCGTTVIIRTNLNVHLREQAGVALPLASSLGGSLRKRIRLELEQPSDAVPILLSWLGTISWNASFLAVNCDLSPCPFFQVLVPGARGMVPQTVPLDRMNYKVNIYPQPYSSHPFILVIHTATTIMMWSEAKSVIIPLLRKSISSLLRSLKRRTQSFSGAVKAVSRK